MTFKQVTFSMLQAKNMYCSDSYPNINFFGILVQVRRVFIPKSEIFSCLLWFSLFDTSILAACFMIILQNEPVVTDDCPCFQFTMYLYFIYSVIFVTINNVAAFCKDSLTVFLLLVVQVVCNFFCFISNRNFI